MENENKTDSFVIHDPEALYEADFQARWDLLADGAVLTESNGSRVEILSRGEWNHEAGPDFRNAKIRYRGKILHGDIELHRKSSDYIRHGHLADAAYDNVILHVVEEDDLSGREEGSAMAHIPVCRLSPDMLARRSGSICRCRIIPYMHREQLRQFFTDAGMERIQAKSSAVLETLIRSGSGPAFRQVLFRAAGYKRNQDGFNELLRRLEQYPPEVFQAHFEALLWGESTLLPDPAEKELPEPVRDRIRLLWDEFWSLRLTAADPIPWKRDSVRPLNSPERRIAMLAEFLRQFSADPLPALADELRKQNPEQLVKKLRRQLNFSDPFWDLHCSWHSDELARKAAVLGSERAETLLIDVIAPSLLAYAKLNNDQTLENKALALPLLIKPQKNNRVFKNAVRRWFPENDPRLDIFDNAAAVQGCLHIHRKYCADTAGDCVSCLLVNSVL